VFDILPREEKKTGAGRLLKKEKKGLREREERKMRKGVFETKESSSWMPKERREDGSFQERNLGLGKRPRRLRAAGGKGAVNEVRGK